MGASWARIPHEASNHTLKILACLQLRRIITANTPPAEINEHLIELIKEAISVRQKLLSNPELCIESLTSQLDLYKGRITSLIKLSWLAPKIMRAILEGRQPLDLTPSRLLRLAKDLPLGWDDQHRLLGIPALSWSRARPVGIWAWFWSCTRPVSIQARPWSGMRAAVISADPNINSWLKIGPVRQNGPKASETPEFLSLWGLAENYNSINNWKIKAISPLVRDV